MSTNKFDHLKVGDRLISTDPYYNVGITNIECISKCDNVAKFSWLRSNDHPFSLTKEELEKSLWKIRK